MTNIFKTNSRFSGLLDNKDDFKKDKGSNKKEEKLNSFKCSEKKESRFKYCNEKEKECHRLEIETAFKIQQELKKKEKDQLKLESLSMNNFPELISVAKRETDKQEHISYIDVLKKQETEKPLIDPDLVNLQPGWLLIKKDRETGNTITKYGPGTVLYEEPKKSENEIGLDDLYQALVDLHEKRTEEYIELNGYDIWEKMFKYPNWQEREAYLYQIEDFEDTSDDEGDQNDDEYYDDYDDYDDY